MHRKRKRITWQSPATTPGMLVSDNRSARKKQQRIQNSNIARGTSGSSIRTINRNHELSATEVRPIITTVHDRTRVEDRPHASQQRPDHGNHHPVITA